jgi:hypothetical protein
MIDHEPIPDRVDLPETFQAILLQRLESIDLDLPLLPTLAWELIAMIQVEDVDARHFADLIHPTKPWQDTCYGWQTRLRSGAVCPSSPYSRR